MQRPFLRQTLVVLALAILAIVPLRAVAQSATSPADIILAAHSAAFLQTSNGYAWFRETNGGGRSAFWTTAEQMEMELDAYERTRSPQQMAVFTNLFKGFIARHGKVWRKNDFNDDIMWMVIACSRAYLMTGNKAFLDSAKTNFDMCYARAASTDLGGGLWWKTDNKSKNACINGPAAIAAVLLGQSLKNPSYKTKAEQIYQWERSHLFNTNTGQVYDNMRKNGRLGEHAFTYNEGTFIGAANLLGHYDDALLAGTFTMTNLCSNGILPVYGESSDAGGFNGIFVRWLVKFAKERHVETFDAWLQKNAEAAWKSRRTSDDLSWNDWTRPTPEGERNSFGCSDSVVILQYVPLKTP